MMVEFGWTQMAVITQTEAPFTSVRKGSTMIIYFFDFTRELDEMTLCFVSI